MGILDRLAHAWNAFTGQDKSYNSPFPYGRNTGVSWSTNPTGVSFSRGNEKSIVTNVYNRISLDAAAITIKQVKLDDKGRYFEDVKSSLNYCLTVEANKDQAARAFMHDVVASMFDEGVVAIVPIDTNISVKTNNIFDIHTMRVGRIVEWFPDYVKLEVYNDVKGIKEIIDMPKKKVAIIENPHYAVMNEPNSILQRLIKKLNILDVIDEQSGSGKLDLIIQLPYIVKSEARRKQAESRRADIETQLTGSKYGIAYTDGSEKITQLNRSVENNLLKQIEYFTSMLYDQLGMTTGIMNGTADEQTMLNYLNRTVEPIVAAISDELDRKYVTKTARSQGNKIMFFNDPFKLVPLSKIAEFADKFTRNEIMSSNEIRQIIGFKPINNPLADDLRNKNLNVGSEEEFANTNEIYEDEPQNNSKKEDNQNG